MSLAFGKSLGARGRALSGVRDQYPQPRAFRGIREMTTLPVMATHAQPLAPTPRPVFNGPLGSYGPSGGVSLQPQSIHTGGVRGGATGILIRNRRSNLPQRAAYSGVYGISDADLTAMGWGPQSQWEDPSGGGSGGSSGGGKFKIQPGTVDKLIDLAGSLLGKKQAPVPDPQVYAPVAAPVSTTPSWAVPAIAVGALGLVGAIIYSVVR